ncbi:MAG: ABC transporter ATP-binding protein [Clostridia bacterium]|nr:ABC transporter ATP-binding protein [Clostridia bacterium]
MDKGRINESAPYAVEMRHITKVFPGIVANDDITLQLRRGEIHALLGENGAGKSTLMSVLFGLYQPEGGEIYKNGEKVTINDPNDANALGIGMVHQHFKLVDVFTVLDNIILGTEPSTLGFLRKKEARKKVMRLSKEYGLNVDPDALVEDITVGMQQRTEILKMLYRDNEILIFDEPTAVLTPQEITELMGIIRGLAAEGKSILFISHKLNEIMEIADRCTVLRKGKYVGTVNIAETSKEELSSMMVGRGVKFEVDKDDAKPGETVLSIEHLSVKSRIHKKLAVKDVSLTVRSGEIVCIAGIDGNGQSEFVGALSGLEKCESGSRIVLNGEDVTKKNIRYKNTHGVSHIPEDRHKHGLILDYTLEQNMVLQRYFEPRFQHGGFIKFDEVRKYAEGLIDKYDVRSGQGPLTPARGMSGGNQQKAIIARELDRDHDLLIAVQPTRGLDVGAIEFIHEQIVASRDAGRAVLLVSLELEEVMNLSDRILVMYEGEIVGEFDPKKTTVQELGLYMAGAKRQHGGEGGDAE